MKIDVYRIIETDRSIIGRVAVDGQHLCFGLEPSRLHPVHAFHPCVPAGVVYKVKLTLSPHFGYVTPELQDVPERTHIRFHKGNKPEDSLGCTLVGMSHGPAPDWVSDSKDAFEALMKFCEAAEARGEEITAEYHDLPQQGSVA